MVELSRAHLQDGHFALMWKDTTFNYAYFLWFEDASVSSRSCDTTAESDLIISNKKLLNSVCSWRIDLHILHLVVCCV